MTEKVKVEFGGVEFDSEAHVINTPKGCSIEFVDVPVVINYNEETQLP